jgi:hypothetical protein
MEISPKGGMITRFAVSGQSRSDKMPNPWAVLSEGPLKPACEETLGDPAMNWSAPDEWPAAPGRLPLAASIRRLVIGRPHQALHWQRLQGRMELHNQTGDPMKEIIEKEAARRTALFKQALDLILPILQVMKVAKENNITCALHLYPPQTRGDDSVYGLMLCRSFHNSTGRRRRRYRLEISPGDKSVLVSLESGHLMSYEDYQDNYENSDLVWGETYYLDRPPTIATLTKDIEEALITDAVEARTNLRPSGV